MPKKKMSAEKRILKYELTHRDKIVLAVIGVIGAVFFFKGLSTMIDNVKLDPGFLVILGLILMFCSGYLIKK